MRRVSLLLLIVFASDTSANATAVWDALPALEPTHLAGPYAGRQVCPVCAHGYDAGILLFMPRTITADQARMLARNLAPATLAPAQPRFRVFAIVAGKANPTLRDALRNEDDRWLVASLEGKALEDAKRDLAGTWSETAHAYVFSQRRLVRLLTAAELFGADDGERRAAAQYALQFLSIMHPMTELPRQPETPQGAMWFAPAKLRAQAGRESTAGAAREVCFVTDDGRRMASALVSVDTVQDSARWARTDASGCIGISTAAAVPLDLTLYEYREPQRSATVDAAALRRRIAQAKSETRAPHERIVGAPCEGCEAVFIGLPATLSSRERIAPRGEPGVALRLQGTVRTGEGRPAADTIVYAYQTDASGVYPRDPTHATRHGRLRGWVRTDSEGHFVFDTIRPGAYPSRNAPAHIHLHVIEPTRCTYYIEDVMFDDDPLLDNTERMKDPNGRGGPGIVRPVLDANGVWHATRDIELGRNVPGYERCASPQ